jgi:CHAD domain-containing protein
MTPDLLTAVDEPITFCRYGRWLLRRQLRAFAQEIAAVRSAEGPEAVHRMRVASRRIRAALPLFSGCFGRSRVDGWRRSFRAITRALGEARDLDVQIEFIQEYRDRYFPGEKGQEFLGRIGYCYADLRGRSKTGPALHAGRLYPRIKTLVRYLATPERKDPISRDPVPGGGQPEKRGQGIACLLLRLHQKRALAQRSIEDAVIKIGDSGIIEEIHQHLYDVAEGKPGDRTRVDRKVYLKALSAIISKMHDLLVLEPFLADPADKARHHEFRILVKRLRYTLEAFGQLYADRLKEYVTCLKEIQDILGEIHDCDVWMEMLPRFLEEEKGRIEEFFGENSFFNEIEPDITELLSFVTKRRNDLFEAMTVQWNTLVRDRVFERLVASLESYAGIPLIDASLWHETRTSGEAPPQKNMYAVIGTLKADTAYLDKFEERVREHGATCNLLSGCLTLPGGPTAPRYERVREGPYISVACRKVQKIAADEDILDDRRERTGKSRVRSPKRWARLHPSDQQYLASLPPMLRIRDGSRVIRVIGDRILKKSQVESLLLSDTGLGVLTRLFPADVLIFGDMGTWHTGTAGSSLVIQAGNSGPGSGKHPSGFCMLRITPPSVDFVPVETPGVAFERTGSKENTTETSGSPGETADLK